MAQKPTIPTSDALSLLHHKLGQDISKLSLLSGGEWSQAYSFMQGDRKHVMRWCKSTEGFAKDALASQFDSSGLPVPALSLQGRAFDTFYAISTFAPGNYIETLSTSELVSTLPALMSLFDALRSADLSQTSGYGLWDARGQGSHTSWKAYVLDVINDHEGSITHGWSEHLQSQSNLREMFNSLYEILEKHVDACPESRELIHSDLLNFNVLALDHKISGVIDWQCSMYGDSLYDIAWFLYYAPWYPQFASIGLEEKILTHFQQTATHTENIDKRLLCYYLHIGLGSIAYNAFKKDWQAAQEAENYTSKLIKNSNQTLD